MSDSPFNFQPVIIIGAARSGTNMLRDMLTQLPGVTTWPCDEINYVWRHRNVTVSHDQFSPDHARPVVRRYIRRAFEKRARRDKCQFLVEKTCANSMRVGFVDAIIPEAKYVFLVRDGRDVVASAIKRWTAPMDIRYIAKKARFVPPADMIYHAGRYATHRVCRLFSAQRRLSTWGPRFVGMREMLATRSLEEVCAAQWARSVESSLNAFERIHVKRVVRLKYEALTERPEVLFAKLLQFLGIDASVEQLRMATRRATPKSIGNWQTILSTDAIERIAPIVEPQLAALQYVPDVTTPQRAVA